MVSPGFDQVRFGAYKDHILSQSREPSTSMLCCETSGWRKPADRTNYIGILLTGLLVSRFIGSPAALFNGNQPELGKSVFAQILAILRDGHHVETASQRERRRVREAITGNN